MSTGTYYAAQVGIGLKARDSSSRDFLLNLLDLLEQLKSAIGLHDAIDVETVSAAYVENFALKVFANADNEDRSGRATRYVSTDLVNRSSVHAPEQQIYREEVSSSVQLP